MRGGSSGQPGGCPGSTVLVGATQRLWGRLPGAPGMGHSFLTLLTAWLMLLTVGRELGEACWPLLPPPRAVGSPQPAPECHLHGLSIPGTRPDVWPIFHH